MTAHPQEPDAPSVTATLKDPPDGTASGAPTALRGRQLSLVLIAVMLAALLAALDQTIVATARSGTPGRPIPPE
ncbi:MAG TPA: hypothetical protein VEF89_00460 [Solirubrobacteraceae bacterium]|nr:hypothetical protein [Solirubrobacteraceae bacterium]